MLRIDDLRGGWGPTTIIEGCRLHLSEGEICALLGRNGVGKTTLLELITGRARHRAGTIRLDGKNLVGTTLHARARAGLAHVPQQREVFPSLTVAENLDVATRPGRWTRQRLLDLFPSLAARLHAKAAHLSGGEQQMLAIARALASNPRLLLMDEPSEGLAPVVVEQLLAAIRAMAADGLTILLVEQNFHVAIALSDRCLVMERGRIVHDGPSEALRRSPSDVSDLLF
jgi:branched-chain amino acid transport system ATP-binding protein